MRTISAIFALVPILFSAVAYGAIDTTELLGHRSTEKNLRLESPTSVRIESKSGDVTLAESNGSDIEIVAENRGDKPVKLHLENEDGRLRIWLEYPETKAENLGGIFKSFVGRGSVVITSHANDVNVVIDGKNVITGGGSIDLTVRIPKHLLNNLEADLAMGDLKFSGYFAESEGASRRRIDLKTSHGSVICREMCGLGKLVVRSSMGDLSFENVIGALDAKTSHGDVLVKRSLGNMELVSSMGDITAKDSVGDVYGKTSHGDVRITGQSGGSVEGKSSMGDIYFDNPEATSEEGRSSMGDVRRTPGFRRKETPGSPLHDKCVEDLVRQSRAL